MTKTKFFMGLGSLVLASAAFMAAKPTKMITGNDDTAFVQIGPNQVAVIALNNFTTIATNGHSAYFATRNGVSTVKYALQTDPSGSGGKVSYFK